MKRGIFCSALLLLVLLSILYVAQPVAAAAAVRQFVTCKAIDESKSPYEPVEVTDTFFTTDEKIWALLVLEDVKPPIVVGIAYFRPDGTKLGPATYRFTQTTGEPVVSYAVYLDIAEAAKYTGQWRVEGYADGALVSTIYFTLSPPRPVLHLAQASIEPGPEEPIYAGDLVSATYTLQNVGVATATRVEIRIVDSPPDVVVETTPATDLAPGSSGKWQVNMKPQKAGEFQINFSFFIDGVKQVFRYADGSEKDVFRITLTVSPRAAFLVIQDVVTEPSADEPFYVGDVGTVTYVVQNTGETAGKNVEIKVVSAPSEIEIVQITAPKDLQPGSTGEWQVKVKATKPGTYDVYVAFYVDEQKVVFQVEGETGTIEQFKTTVTVSERPLLETYGFYLIVLVVIIVVVAVVLMRRGRGRAVAAPPTIPPAAPPQVPASTAQRFCVNCGASIPSASKFCGKCGAQQS